MQSSSREGLKSAEYSSLNMTLALAVFVLLVGCSICAAIMPDALQNRHYPMIMFMASLPCIGIAGLWLALKNRTKQTQFGQTRLLLDPEIPGIGGQLGGRFTLTSKDHKHQFKSQPNLLATLSCIKASGSGDHDRNGGGVSVNILWQNTQPVFLAQSANGLEATFVIELPDSCKSSNASDINWQVRVEGDFEQFGEFSRTWDVYIDDEASQSTSVNIPLNFSEHFETKERKKAEIESVKAIPLKTDENHIKFSSQWLSKGAGTAGVIFGAILGSIGILINGGPNFIFMLLGLGVAAASIYAANKKTRIAIEKKSQTISVYHELFGQSSLAYEGKITSPEQFTLCRNGWR